MYPVLLKIWGIPVHSYYVIWALALSVGLVRTRARSVRLYGMDDETVRRTLIWAFVGMLLGARIGGYFDHWSYYVANPVDIINPLKGALSSTTAFLGAGIAAILYLRRRGNSISPLAEAASLPAALTVSIGRVGCFLNGCCLGIPADLPWSVSFPRENYIIYRHPVQLYYSAGAFLIFLILLMAEKKLNSCCPKRKGSFLWPLFMILYGSFRFAVDFVREGDRIAGLRTAQIVGIVIAAGGLLWIILSLNKNKVKNI